MTLLSNFDSEAQRIIVQFNNIGTSRTKAVSIALAKYLANHLVLPSGEVDSVDMFYRSTHYVEVSAIVNALNETLLLDINYVLHLVQAFYKQRYYSAYPKDEAFALSTQRPIADFFGISLAVDDMTLAEIMASSWTITRYYRDWATIVTQVRAVPYFDRRQ